MGFWTIYIALHGGGAASSPSPSTNSDLWFRLKQIAVDNGMELIEQ